MAIINVLIPAIGAGIFATITQTHLNNKAKAIIEEARIEGYEIACFPDWMEIYCEDLVKEYRKNTK